MPLGPLTPVDPDAVAEGDDDLDGVSVGPLQFDRVIWTGRRRLGSSRVTGFVARRWEAKAASFVGSVLEGIDVVSLSAPGSSWWNVEVLQSRLGSAELYDAVLRNVHFVRCKISFLNLRGATLTDVAFTDCIFEDAELMRATATRLAFPGTIIGRLELAGSSLADVDLREARLTDVGTLEGLRGATITSDQLQELAPALAARIGIKVE